MNYPIKVKKAFNRMRYQVQDVWQNLRLLKRHISCLVRSIDDVGTRVNRSRQLLHGLGLQHTESVVGQSGARENVNERYIMGGYR